MHWEHRQSDPAHPGPADRPIGPRRWLPPLLFGVIVLATAGLTCGAGMAYGAPPGDLETVAPVPAPMAGAMGAAFALLGVGVPVAIRRRGAHKAAGRTHGVVVPTPRCPVEHHAQGIPVDSRETGEVDRAEAEEFLRMFHAENPAAGPVEPRIAAVLREIDLTGTYWHTPDELAFGARAAWRNNARCIGRLYWRSLQVRDLRTVSDATRVARYCFGHLDAAINGGKIRPTISVFAPETPSRPAPRIWNEQLIRYAGYEQPDGSILGDPRYVAFTREMIRRGWRPPVRRGAFDVLPLVVETAEEGPRMFPLPDDRVHEVELEHPELDWFADLGMRWHSVPVISNNRLVIGGVSYPAAPFNGWYMGTEIGARNLGDSERYDLVPAVAERMGLDTTDDASLWRDRALVEINRAVLHSFQASGVSITDHHTESRRFLTHVEREERAGRTCPADWTWIVPPMSGSQTPVFHRYYDNEDRLPNFFGDTEATRRALQGGPPAFPVDLTRV
ncbi:MAG TPA: nitric oxide synthase oxygenase [Nocardioides sp.]|nr:nitric oxide synthase oxygenase [Nocardioides sp.]